MSHINNEIAGYYLGLFEEAFEHNYDFDLYDYLNYRRACKEAGAPGVSHIINRSQIFIAMPGHSVNTRIDWQYEYIDLFLRLASDDIPLHQDNFDDYDVVTASFLPVTHTS